MSEIGVVIPVYNGERYLAETLESVLAQTFAAWELVVVDDGSTDRSGAIAEAFATRDARVRLICKANSGVAMARNAGFRALESNCEFVAFLDQDDTWYPESLTILRALLVADPQATAAHGNNRRMDADGQPMPRSEREARHWQRWGFEGVQLIRWAQQRPTTLEVLAFMDPIVTPGQVLIRRSALLAASGFDPSLAPADDWDLWLRLARYGYFAYTNSAVLGYRLHDANVSLQMDLMQEAKRAVRRRHAGSAALDRAQRSLFVRGYVWEHWFISKLRTIWALEHWRRGNYVQALKDLRHAARERYQFENGRFRLRWHSAIHI